MELGAWGVGIGAARAKPSPGVRGRESEKRKAGCSVFSSSLDTRVPRRKILSEAGTLVKTNRLIQE